MRKIRCAECGAIVAFCNDDGTITVMCNHSRVRGQRCKAVTVIATVDEKPNTEKKSVTN